MGIAGGFVSFGGGGGPRRVPARHRERADRLGASADRRGGIGRVRGARRPAPRRDLAGRSRRRPARCMLLRRIHQQTACSRPGRQAGLLQAAEGLERAGPGEAKMADRRPQQKVVPGSLMQKTQGTDEIVGRRVDEDRDPGPGGGRLRRRLEPRRSKERRLAWVGSYPRALETGPPSAGPAPPPLRRRRLPRRLPAAPPSQVAAPPPSAASGVILRIPTARPSRSEPTTRRSFTGSSGCFSTRVAAPCTTTRTSPARAASPSGSRTSTIRSRPFYEERPEQNRPIVIYCTGGDCEDSHMLAEKLYMVGFNALYVYKDGFPDWQKRGLPIRRQRSRDLVHPSLAHDPRTDRPRAQSSRSPHSRRSPTRPPSPT